MISYLPRLLTGPLEKALTAATGRRPELYYWRSHAGFEVDLLLRLADRLVPIASGATTSASDPPGPQPTDRRWR